MKPIVDKILKVVVPLAVSVGLVVWLFHKIDFERVVAIVRDGVRYEYIAMMMVLTVGAYMIRGVRWGIQLRAAGIPRMPVMAESVSIFGAYALNLVVPYMGEAWRCVYVARREKTKITTVVGTDLGDRISDFVVIVALIIVSLIVARPALMRFMDHYKLGEEITRVATNGELWGWIVAILLVAIGACVIWRKSKIVQSILAGIKRIWQGFAVLFTMKGKGAYLVLTIGIWVCYFFSNYLCFFAFPFTRHLITDPGMAYGFLPGLVVFVFGSCSMGVPSNGGLGTWNIAVMFALSLYGVSDTDGAAYSLVCWSFQAIAQVAAGIYAFVYIRMSDAKQRKSVGKS